ncbi:nitroreductase family deazaflavin-dependent oxidoreductase [Nocardia farcinica]|uniref:Deazaflavin-dependent oxidoreductase, nitroreductase family n=2 Tax=Nocardia farcinica TaxID=37329 RepID=Q5YN89_NOCFA|nr:nitroreductase/quinone reductase family protein [Nocardia farcinica]SLI03856.1 protein of uncharacterised function (DUF385) [Mycobacteroides abscessus subsp. abscessus]AXK87266.1 DUF385 domain-containing protein [Nocardia farcinica]MBF6140663.1 nitroreductase family deazaflavin-dependent oxidoreductase [Nocardia farcinica]MBF6255103.1 nitroreductase family deazaflavin-dependent oxidoreductase [Nocardia farcinica]MBF6268996.1 nitroreductase family deazaflavin-dependent oxidoreductase [Nocard
MTTATRYLAPTGLDTVFNRIMPWLPRLGIDLMGARMLAVRGRTSGQWRTTIVNLLEDETGARYLVAPRGRTQWVRNLRVAGGGELRLGRTVEPFVAAEVDDADKTPILRLYLRKWGWEVGRFFEGVTKDSSDAELAAIAPGFPVFRIQETSAA